MSCFFIGEKNSMSISEQTKKPKSSLFIKLFIIFIFSNRASFQFSSSKIALLHICSPSNLINSNSSFKNLSNEDLKYLSNNTSYNGVQKANNLCFLIVSSVL